MGRGRQRAKQRKVARDLKYYSPKTDFGALARELSSYNSESKSEREATADTADSSYEYDSYGEDTYADEYAAYEEYAAKYEAQDDEE